MFGIDYLSGRPAHELAGGERPNQHCAGPRPPEIGLFKRLDSVASDSLAAGYSLLLPKPISASKLENRL